MSNQDLRHKVEGRRQRRQVHWWWFLAVLQDLSIDDQHFAFDAAKILQLFASQLKTRDSLLSHSKSALDVRAHSQTFALRSKVNQSWHQEKLPARTSELLCELSDHSTYRHSFLLEVQRMTRVFDRCWSYRIDREGKWRHLSNNFCYSWLILMTWVCVIITQQSCCWRGVRCSCSLTLISCDVIWFQEKGKKSYDNESGDDNSLKSQFSFKSWADKCKSCLICNYSFHFNNNPVFIYLLPSL